MLHHFKSLLLAKTNLSKIMEAKIRGLQSLRQVTYFSGFEGSGTDEYKDLNQILLYHLSMVRMKLKVDQGSRC